MEKAIGILGSSNPEWEKEKSILASDFHSDRVALTWEAINLLTLGIAQWGESATKANVSNAKAVALWQSAQKPLARLPAEEARLKKLLNSTADPDLASAILKYMAALHRLEETQKYGDAMTLGARFKEAAFALRDEFEIMKRKPPGTNVSDALYESSALMGSFALVFYENPVSMAGNALTSFAVGGRALVNTWDENRRYDALMRDASRREQERHVLMFRLEDLRQKRERLSSSLKRSR